MAFQACCDGETPVMCMQGFHRPIYTPSLEGVTLASDQGVAEDLRNAWETIFFQYEVSHWLPDPRIACGTLHMAVLYSLVMSDVIWRGRLENLP